MICDTNCGQTGRRCSEQTGHICEQTGVICKQTCGKQKGDFCNILNAWLVASGTPCCDKLDKTRSLSWTVPQCSDPGGNWAWGPWGRGRYWGSSVSWSWAPWAPRCWGPATLRCWHLSDPWWTRPWAGRGWGHAARQCWRRGSLQSWASEDPECWGRRGRECWAAAGGRNLASPQPRRARALAGHAVLPRLHTTRVRRVPPCPCELGTEGLQSETNLVTSECDAAWHSWHEKQWSLVTRDKCENAVCAITRGSTHRSEVRYVLTSVRECLWCWLRCLTSPLGARYSHLPSDAMPLRSAAPRSFLLMPLPVSKLQQWGLELRTNLRKDYNRGEGPY